MIVLFQDLVEVLFWPQELLRAGLLVVSLVSPGFTWRLLFSTTIPSGLAFLVWMSCRGKCRVVQPGKENTVVAFRCLDLFKIIFLSPRCHSKCRASIPALS